MSSWPNPDAPGRPADVSTKQFHMFRHNGNEHILRWDPETQLWDHGMNVFSMPENMVHDNIEYLGPAQVRLAPAEDEEPTPLERVAMDSLMLFLEAAEALAKALDIELPELA